MSKTSLIKRKSGLILLISSLLFYCLVKLPFNLSVVCTSSNEGFYFVFSQYLLDTHKFDFIRGPLFIFIYALVVKLFGFGTWSIIAVHFVQTFTVCLIGISLFYLGKIVLKSDFFSGLTVLFFILFQVTPIGGWGLDFEFESAFALECEYFCILFSIWSLICLLNISSGNKSKFLYFLAGIFAAFSFASKASGIIIVIALFCWCIYLFFFQKKHFLNTISNISFFTLGFLMCVLLFSLVLVSLSAEPLSFWKNSFLIGSYSKSYLKSPLDFLSNILKFMTRDTNSFNNFFLFFLTFLSLAWGLVRSHILRIKDDFTQMFWTFISIWGIGNIFAVIAPGEYASYYYILVWPAVSIFLSLLLKDLFSFIKIFQMKSVRILICLLISLVFIQRIAVVFPTYLKLAKPNLDLSVFSQPQSFQDPVVFPYSPLPKKRILALWVADLINSQLPDKKDKFYVFNFFDNFPIFSANLYIYAKRSCQTSILSDHLLVKSILEDRAIKLAKVLIETPPQIIIIPKYLHMSPALRPLIKPFLEWLTLFLEKNYHLSGSFDVITPKKNPETCYIYKKI